MIDFIFEHAAHAPYLVFIILSLSGLGLPISEDLVVTAAAVLAATILPDSTYSLFLAVFLGCYTADAIVYWMGRLFGPKLWEIRWFARTVDPKRIIQIQSYYKKYGLLTIYLGRFIPLIRYGIYLTAGLGKMHYGKLACIDLFACLTTNTLLFTLAYQAGKNYELLLGHLKTFNIFLGGAFLVSIIAFIWYKRKKKAAH